MSQQRIEKHISLDVLPFELLTDDPRVEMFCQGVVMDLITDLSRFRPFQILSYDTARHLSPDGNSEGSAIPARTSDYQVRGTAQFDSGMLRINLQLLHGRDKRVVWAERFTGSLDELFRMQDAMVQRIAGSLQQFVDEDLLADLHARPGTSLRVYECWLQGYRELKKATEEGNQRAREFFTRAMKEDPRYARAYTGMSLSYFNEWSCQLWSRWDVSRSGAFDWAWKALELDPWDHVSNAIIGRIYLYNAEYEKAEHFLRKSLRINASDPETLIVIAVGLVYLGHAREARDLWLRMRRINPSAESATITSGTFIHFELGEFDTASDLARQRDVGGGWVDFPAFEAAAHYLRGDTEGMRERWDLYVRQFSERINGGVPADDATALQWMIDVNPYRGETQLRPFWEFMSSGTAVEHSPDRPSTAEEKGNAFHRHGKIWTVRYDGVEAQFPDRKGFHDLVRLLARPHHELHCTDLMSARTIEKGEEVIDDRARDEYRRRIADLEEDIAQATALADAQEIERLQREYDDIIAHLSRSVGKGGRNRRVSGTVEKCRTAVTWRLRSAMELIGDGHPALGRHLDMSIRTGIFCEYAPEHDVRWETD
ncbi:MAG: hypothetical protein RRA94_06970 [Bacteroidota bacterium]|nr:hypothetical protein [Bacteroidota bacterium]